MASDPDTSGEPSRPRIFRGRGLVVTAARGTETIVADELGRLGFTGVKPGHGRVLVADEGLPAAMRACLHLRAALRVLMPLASYPASDGAAVHAGAREVPWERWLTTGSTFAVSGTSRAAPPLAHAAALSLLVKDAIADRLRERLGARPDVDRENPAVRVYVHVESAARSRGGVPGVTVGLDVSGDRLHARGYRVAQGAAPLRETLAAALLLGAGWSGQTPLLDPTCGSGTIAIEAAMLAANVAPGLVGRSAGFSFERWPTFGEAERAEWRRLREEAEAAIRPACPVAILGKDMDAKVLAAAERNAAAAHPLVAGAITWQAGDARQLVSPWREGVVLANPPYGERLGAAGLEIFYRVFGRRLLALRRHPVFLLMPEECGRWLDLEPTWRHPLQNGPLEVFFHRYDPDRLRARRQEKTS